MIPTDIVRQLVPQRFPDDDFGAIPPATDLDEEASQRWIGIWSDYLRFRLRLEASGEQLASRFIRTGMIGTGIVRVADSKAKRPSGFPIVNGYQFGVLMLGAAPAPETAEGSIALEQGELRAPLFETTAMFNPHVGSGPEGYVAATYRSDGRTFGITARHVVDRYRRAQSVPVECSDCFSQARLVARAPGLIDAAKVEFPCGGPTLPHVAAHARLRSPTAGDTVDLHLGSTGRKIATVMMSLSSPEEILSAATPKHFLTDEYGHFGDSGSLVAANGQPPNRADLLGLYLGDADCRDADGASVTYGYGLDLRQAADLLGASNLKGEYHD